VTRFEAIDPAAGPLSAGVASGALEVRAGNAQAIGDTVLQATGTGCVQDECGRPLIIEVPVTVIDFAAPAGEPDAFTAPSPDREASAEPIPGAMAGATLSDEVLVVLGSDAAPGDRDAADAAAQAVGARVAGGLEDTGIYQLRWTTPQDIPARIAQLEALESVESASPSAVGTLAEGAIVPPFKDWDDDGPEVKWPFELVRAPTAWDRVPGQGRDLPVGIIETEYVAEAHEDLTVRRLGLYVQGLRGGWHATHVAGLACAKQNDIGLVGVGWGCPLISASASGGEAGLLQAMKRMAETDARVVNMSLYQPIERGRCVTREEADKYHDVEFLQRGAPFTRFYARGGKAIVWTVIAGNECADRAQAPWAQGADVLDNVISVAATNSDGKLASLSSFGAQVEVSAPGGVYTRGAPSGVWSTWNGAESFAECGPGYQYCHAYGTSMAAPIVAGIAALVRSQNPSLDADQVGRCITETAGHQTGWVESWSPLPSGYTRQVAYGGTQPLVDAASAVQCHVDLMTSKVGGGGKPHSIVEGPDGAMWFTMPEANRLGRTTTGDDVTFIDLPAGGRPVFITSGPDGNLWYTKQEPGRIGRVTPAGAVTEFPLNPSNGWPFGIVTGPDGNLWFTEIIGNRVGRITPSGSITTWPLTAGRGPAGIVVGADGALWFSKNHSGDGLGRITTAGAITDFPVGGGGGVSWSVARGPDDQIWFISDFKVKRMSTNGTITDVVASDGMTIASGPRSTMWLVERDFPRGANLAQVKTSGEIVRYPLAGFDDPISADYGHSAPGPGNWVWWAVPENSRLARLQVPCGAEEAAGRGC
jgi:hypothetical protein